MPGAGRSPSLRARSAPRSDVPPCRVRPGAREQRSRRTPGPATRSRSIDSRLGNLSGELLRASPSAYLLVERRPPRPAVPAYRFGEILAGSRQPPGTRPPGRQALTMTSSCLNAAASMTCPADSARRMVSLADVSSGHGRGALVSRALLGHARAPRRVHARSPVSRSGRSTRLRTSAPSRSGSASRASIRSRAACTRACTAGRLWTMRQFAGFGTAEETNERFRYLLDHGQTGLTHRLRHAVADGARLRPRALARARSAARAWRSTRSTTCRRCSAASTSARSRCR